MDIARTGAVMALTAVGPALPLGAVGWVGWGRTKDLRRGRAIAAVGPDRGEIRTSRATFIPAGCGISVLAAGLLLAGVRTGRGPPVGAILLISAGVAIAAAGLAARVTCIVLDGRGLSIRFGARRRFAVEWADVAGLSPPRWPLGGWAVRSRSGMRLLMPSDLLGHESVLASIVVRARLRFDGREWST